MRLAWLTDIHLNFLHRSAFAGFMDAVESARPDAVLIGGDIAEAPDLTSTLSRVAQSLSCPIYFVLGNHDFYHGSIRAAREEVSRLCRANPRLIWLNEAGVVELQPGLALVGHDGWADARLGDYERSLVRMNDHRLIAELAAVDKECRWPILQTLGDEAAEHIRATLPQAVRSAKQTILLTHVPPFRESCLYEGKISNDEWLPHFTCHALGQAILEVMRPNPERKLLVLCGHTHSPAEYDPLPNIHVITGGAEYGLPQVQRVFEF